MKECLSKIRNAQDEENLVNFSYYNKIMDVVTEDFSDLEEKKRDVVLLRVLDSLERVDRIRV
ncbi:MAG: hypothetical protein HWN81_14920 [Candidatus Lokiarchaeota archaeon]|nr:hypothetical protein [Candidatus Lokiarchaeota archaeon]